MSTVIRRPPSLYPATSSAVEDEPCERVRGGPIAIRPPFAYHIPPMLEAITFFDLLWDTLRWLPHVLTILGGVGLGIGLFSSRGWEPTCRRCRHDLRGVRDEKCPECGANLAAPRGVQPGRRCVSPTPTVLGIVAIALGLLPQVGLRPQDLRLAFVRQLPKSTIAERWIAGNNWAQAIHLEFVTRNDAEYHALLVELAERRVKNGAFVGSADPLLSHLLIFGPRNGSGTIDSSLLPLFKAVVDRASVSELDAKKVIELLPHVEFARGPEGQRIIAASDAIARSYISLTAQPRGISGEPISLQSGWNGFMFFGSDLRPTITQARWRPAGTDVWKTLSAAERTDRDPLFPEFVPIDHEGEIEIEADLTLAIPAGAAGKDTPARSITVTRSARSTLARRESLAAKPVRGTEVHELVEPTLGSLLLSKFGSTIQPRMFLRRLGPTRGSRTIQFGGTLALLYDGKTYPLGEFVYSTQGGGGGGSRGDTGLEGITFEPGKPLVLRIVPDVSVFRSRMQSDFEYADEVIELEFDGLEQPPKAIRWNPPEARSNGA